MLRPASAFLTKLITGVNAQWRGCPPAPDRLRIYFANHGSHLDFATLWACLPAAAREKTRPVAARDYWGKTAVTRATAVGLFNALLISRDSITRKDNPIEQMATALREGQSLIIFPEGTRSADGVMTGFKPGLYHLAAKVPEAELVPVYLQNLNRILPKGHLLPIPLLSSVVFGPPLTLEPEEKKLDFLRRAELAVASLAPPATAEDIP